jgi:hypothetical protein
MKPAAIHRRNCLNVRLRRGLVLTVPFAAIRPRGFMTVTHNGKQYTVKRCALNNNEWRLTSLTNPREQVTLNRWQMHVAGLLAQVEDKK